MVSSCFSHTFVLYMLFIPCSIIFYVLCMLDGWSNWVDLARSSFGVLSVYFFPKLSVVTIQLEHFTLVEWCLVVLTILLLIYYVLCMLDGWGHWVDLARSSFGVLPVYLFPNLSVVTLQLEHFTPMEWCLVVLVILMLYVLFNLY